LDCKLSILICTIPERKELFNELVLFLSGQVQGDKLNWPIEILTADQPRGTISIGAKRQSLLNSANGKYVVFVDDDDLPYENYIQSILTAIETGPDCVGFKIRMTTNGQNPETCIHSLQNKKWEKRNGVYLRSVTHFNPVKRELALQVGFKDMHFGEDHDYSNRLTPLCKTEVFIDEFLFDYRYSNKEKHNEKYGIKK